MLPRWLATKVAAEALLFIYKKKKTFNTEISNAGVTNYTHTSHVLTKFRKLGLSKRSEISINGRVKNVELTEKGKEIAEHLLKIKEVFGQLPPNKLSGL